MNNPLPDPAILIHGAWQGSWVWDRVIPLLARSAGIASIAIDLPGNGTDGTRAADVSLDLYVDYVGAVLKRLSRRASLVAHSGGGVVASAVAERFPERVCRIAYVAGMMLPDGMAFAELVDQLKADHSDAAGIAPHLVWSHDRLSSCVPMGAALAYFFHDCPPADAVAAARRLTPQPDRGRAVRAHLTGKVWPCPTPLHRSGSRSLGDSGVPATNAGVGARSPGRNDTDWPRATTGGATASSRRAHTILERRRTSVHVFDTQRRTRFRMSIQNPI